MNLKTSLLAITLFLTTNGFTQTISIAVVKYGGGGDWYANPTSLPNLIRFPDCNAANDGSSLHAITIMLKFLHNY